MLFIHNSNTKYMRKKTLINYWNNFYGDKKKFGESSFARFVLKKIKNKKNFKIIDIGCGNGRDSFFFSKKKFNVTGVDISSRAIKRNKIFKNKNLNFLKFDIEKDKLNKKFNIIYIRFFLHAISTNGEKKLLNLNKSISVKDSFVFFEFRNWHDTIFGKSKNYINNEIVEFEKGHYRRIINPKVFVQNFLKKIKSKVLYFKSSKNLSIIKKDNPNLSRIIFKIK